jgi:uncharacterized Zn finger protein
MGRRRSRRGRPGPRREEWYGGFPPRSKPLAAQGGIKAQSRSGDFGQSWWAKRWQAVLDSFHLGGRLARGRTYARQGQVLSIDVGTGKVKARVQGSRPEPYDVTIAVQQLSSREWGEVLEVLSRQALFVAKLLAGEMPHDIERAFAQAELSLFPQRRGDLKTSCSCPDEANPCKHIAAVYYLLGEEFDRDPFLLFRLRGLEREALVARLGKQARPGGAAPAEAEPAPLPREALSAAPAEFWQGEPVGDLFGEVEAPPVEAAVVRRLGKFPFWRGEKPLVDALEPAYLQASKRGLEVFLGERKEEEG